MFEVGFSELLLIMGLALLVLGPEKLPKVVGQIGRWMGRARAMARQFREQLEDETAEIDRQRNAPPPAPTASPESPAPESSNTPSADSNNVTPPNEPRT
ncbi:MAG: twin-arginine translocase subunit TatB [Gammaproteobacteria bacterium]|jgi:sec-independent protein translocase protein TatB|nr:twin-arginine translocase subunit TatB [Gammaproteobacteria bacterium]